MPRYSTYDYVYVKDTVYFPNDIKVKYRKGKRIVLGFIHWLKTCNQTFDLKTFRYFLKYIWPEMKTVNRPTYDILDWNRHYLKQAFNYDDLYETYDT